MKKEVKTPLGVVYVNDKKRLSMSENLDLCRVSQVWGIYLYAEIGKINIFVSKNNGADLSLMEASVLSENLCALSAFDISKIPYFENMLNENRYSFVYFLQKRALAQMSKKSGV